MKPKVLFIGSIGAVAETSELQRQAYNQALQENGINWQWDTPVYKRLLKSNGGQDRLDMLATATGVDMPQDKIKSIHARKTELAGNLIKEHQVQPRAGLKNLIHEAKKAGTKVAWVTTTGRENTDSILAAFDGEITHNDFDHIFHREDAEFGKPQPHIYKAAMKHFKCKPHECIAIEDSLNSTLAAKGAGIYTVTTLGDYHDEHVEGVTDKQYDSLDQTNWNDLTAAYKNSIITPIL